MISTDPSSSLFYHFHPIFYPQDKEERMVYYRFHNASLKYSQYKYCKKKILELSVEFKTNSGVELDDEKISMLNTYLDGFIITSRTVTDLMVSGLIMKRGISKSIDSASKFLNKFDKKDDYKILETYEYWVELKKELFNDEFSWTRALFSRGRNRSLRDRTTHKQTINVYPIAKAGEPYELRLETGEKIETEDGFSVPIHQDFVAFIGKIDLGMETLIENIKKEIYGIYEFEIT